MRPLISLLASSLTWAFALTAFAAPPAAAEMPAPARQKEAPPAEVPEKWHRMLQEQLREGQGLVQTLVGDIDGDGKQEWIAIGEPTRAGDEQVSIAIFTPAQGKKPPALRFSQWLEGTGLRTAGAMVRKIAPIGEAVVMVAARPDPKGDSFFVAQIYGWDGKRFKAMIPKGLDFRSQGGFSIEDLDPATAGDEVVGWTYLLGEHEQLFDNHRYAYKVFRWDGFRFLGPDAESRTPGKLANPEEAGRAAGAKKGDLRRQLPRVAEVP